MPWNEEQNNGSLKQYKKTFLIVLAILVFRNYNKKCIVNGTPLPYIIEKQWNI